MEENKKTTALLTVSLVLGIILSIRSLTKTREQEEVLDARMTKLDERVRELENA
jgi:hypothetical protein